MFRKETGQYLVAESETACFTGTSSCLMQNCRDVMLLTNWGGIEGLPSSSGSVGEGKS